jgi:CTP synthase
MCDVDERAVVNATDVASIYDIPTMLHEQGLDSYIVEQLGLPAGEVAWDGWATLLEAVHDPKHEVTIALVGKYVDLPDAYLSVTEALKAGGFAHSAKVAIKWTASDLCETPEGAARELSGVDGILVPGGFGIRGIEGKLGALRFARENGIPTLGICLGLQCMVIEYARDVVGLTGASSSEFDPDTEFLVIATMAEQVDILDRGDLGGTMRLGLYEAAFEPGSIVEELYGAPTGSERHRHRYEVNNVYRDRIAAAGLVFSGVSPDRHLVEFVELPRSVHPFYVGTQAHPELRSRPNRAHPLFRGLIGAALERQQASRLFEVPDPDDESDSGSEGA